MQEDNRTTASHMNDQKLSILSQQRAVLLMGSTW